MNRLQNFKLVSKLKLQGNGQSLRSKGTKTTKHPSLSLKNKAKVMRNFKKPKAT